MIQVSWKNCHSGDEVDPNRGIVGDPANGITKRDWEILQPALTAAHRLLDNIINETDETKLAHLPLRPKHRLFDEQKNWDLYCQRVRGFANLPTRTDYCQKARDLAAKCRWATDMVVLGIGGSALGNMALQAALNPLTYNLLSDEARRGRPRLFVLDNVDPAMVGEVMEILRPRLKTTLVNVISKSGETAETAAQFMIFREMLRNELGKDFARNIVATTDLANGTLHDIAVTDGYDMLPVPDDVGGRFSVLTPVGLFSAAMCGININQLLAGAASMRERCKETTWRQNPAMLLAGLKFLAYRDKGKIMDVMMPYSNRLYSLADWYRQLWAESLGKAMNRDGKEITDRDGKKVPVGPTPIKALGTTDQHSQVQLYLEGPNNKFFQFLEVEHHPEEVGIPLVDDFETVPGMGYLRGKTLGQLLNAEKYATEHVLAQACRPSVTVRFDAITPYSVGEFIYLYEMVTTIAGELFNVDTFDQPAVELGKHYTFGLMDRKGYEHLKEKIQPFDKDFLA